MDKYTKKFKIPYYDGDKYGYIRSVNILKYFGETSSEETDILLEGSEDIKDFGWMLYRWKVEILRYPTTQEKVEVDTWVSKVDRFYAYREFTMTDEEGGLLASASTVWIGVDMKRKRPIRIPKTYSDKMAIIGQANFDDFSDFREELKIEDYSDFKVRRSDIDSNEHVNNTKYLSWLIESVPEDIYREYDLLEFEIIYKKEIKYGDIISTGFEIESEDDDSISFKHVIKSCDKSEEHSFGKTRWIKKD